MKAFPRILLAAGALVAAPAFAETVYLVPEQNVTVYVRDPVTGTYVEQAVVPEEIVVTAPRANEDDLITYDVMDSIASDPRVSGRVGVETYRNDVRLTGRVSTPAQADRAATDARSVPGVREVNNEIRSSVGNF